MYQLNPASIELTKESFEYMSAVTPVTYLYGANDQYINEARITEEALKGNNLFGKRLNIRVFDGIHEVNKEFLLELSVVWKLLQI